MNRTKIEWADYTWNPVTGCWGPGGKAEKPKRCWYCYANRLSFRFKSGLDDPFGPSFYPYRFVQPAKVKKPSRIFVCSMGDLFGDWVPQDWIKAVLNVAKATHFPKSHTFLFLTKNPKRYQEFNPWPANCWLGATITNQADADERIPDLLKAQAAVRFVSVEPMLAPVDLRSYLTEYAGPGARFLSKVNWLILGAMTGPGSKAYQPDLAWVQYLIDQARAAGVACLIKDNLKWPERIQEWPL
jgi:protein gp37